MNSRLSKMLLFKHLWPMLLMILVILGQAVPHTFAAGDTVTVNMASYGGAPTYRASGFIYGLSENATQPPPNMLTDMKCKFFRCGGAQLDAPNGGWINGRYTRRWNAVQAYYNKAKAIGATLVLLPHDLWGADGTCNVPRYPGDNGNWTEYTNFMNQVINDAKASGMTGSNVHWDIWNEPELSYFWGNRSQSQYLEMWRRGFQMIRAAIPTAVIVGPSAAYVPTSGNAWWNNYLNYIKSNNVIPTYMSWHSLASGCDPVTEANNLNGMLSSRAVSVNGYQVNEYGGTGAQNAGCSAWYIARLERANGGIDGLRANWGMYTGLYAGMGDLCNASWQPFPQWWVYKRYADMTGLRTSITPGPQIDGVVFQDSGTKKAMILLGNKGGITGAVSVIINNIPSWLVTNGQVKILQERMPDGASYLSAPAVVSNGPVGAGNNSITFTVNWNNAADAYCLTLTPGSEGPTPTPTPAATPTPTPGSRSAYSQIEAESYNTQSGIQTESCGEGGQDVGYIENGDYVVYNSIDFGSGATGFQARVATATSGGSIEIRLDSTAGTLVGTCPVAGTGGWQTWVTNTCNVSGGSGTHNLYLRFTGGSGYLFNINWFKFTSGIVSPTSRPTSTQAPTLTPTPTPTGSYVRFRNVATSLYIDGMGYISNGSNCCQYSSSASYNQQWMLEVAGSYYKIKNRASGLYLDGMGRTSNGSICSQWASSSSNNQQWSQETVGSNVKYKNRATGLYLDGMGSATNGSNLCQWSGSSSTNQQWQIQ